MAREEWVSDPWKPALWNRGERNQLWVWGNFKEHGTKVFKKYAHTHHCWCGHITWWQNVCAVWWQMLIRVLHNNTSFQEQGGYSSEAVMILRNVFKEMTKPTKFRWYGGWHDIGTNRQCWAEVLPWLCPSCVALGKWLNPEDSICSFIRCECLWVFLTSLVAQPLKNQPAMRENWVRCLGWEDPLEEGLATHSSVLA